MSCSNTDPSIGGCANFKGCPHAALLSDLLILYTETVISWMKHYGCKSSTIMATVPFPLISPYILGLYS